MGSFVVVVVEYTSKVKTRVETAKRYITLTVGYGIRLTFATQFDELISFIVIPV